MCIENWFGVHLCCKLVFVHSCTVNWFCPHLYCKLVLIICVSQTGFVYTCTENWFCIHLYIKITDVMECTGDRQEYHTEGTLHMSGNVQGTDRNITLTEHYTWVRMYRGQTGISHWRNITHEWECTGTDNLMNIKGNFTTGHFTQTHTHIHKARL